mgnify:CR=1 FL=1
MSGVFDILSFSDRLDWRNDVSRGRQKLLLQLARDRKIVNFNPPEEWRAVLRHPRAHPPRLYRVQDNLWHFEWGYLYPKFYRQRLAVRVSSFSAQMWVKYLCYKLGIDSPTYLFWGPSQVDLLPHMPRHFTIYYAYDMFEAYVYDKEESREYVRLRETLAASYSQVAFGYSEQICDHLRKKGFRNVHYLPNGVEPDLFLQTVDKREPKQLMSIPHPRLAFIGPVRDNLDIDLFYYVAIKRPKWSQVFVGGTSYIVSREQRLKYEQLTSLPNVYQIGFQPYESIPLFVANIEVGLALYRIDSFANYGSPLKIYEYLAAGKPVVATPISEVMKMGGVVYTAATGEECLASIERALREDTAERRWQRQEWARQHSWQNRARQMTAILEQEYTRWREGQK